MKEIYLKYEIEQLFVLSFFKKKRILVPISSFSPSPWVDSLCGGQIDRIIEETNDTVKGSKWYR